MVQRRTFSAALAAGTAAALLGRHSNAEATVAARNVVLVHGAFADGSSWSEVIGRLQAAGLNVTSVQNPLTSLADDVEATRRALALQDGPTVLVGHSWGGTVITEAGDDPKVCALVFVAARAPDVGEDYTALAAKFPKPPASAGIVRVGGFSQLTEETFLNHFAGGIERAKARVLYAVQGRIANNAVCVEDDGGSLEKQALLVRSLQPGQDHRARARTFPRKADACDDDRAGLEPSFSRHPPEGDHDLDHVCRSAQQLGGRRTHAPPSPVSSDARRFLNMTEFPVFGNRIPIVIHLQKSFG